MNLRFKGVSSVLAIATCSAVLTGIFADVAGARDSTNRRGTPPRTLPEQFDRTFFRNDPTFFNNQGILRQLSTIFGVPSFVDNEISRDGRGLDRLYRDVLQQQVSNDPTLRTPDLPNPFSGSLLTTPLAVVEEEIPPAPPSPIIRQSSVVEPPAREAPAPRPTGPVPALW